MKRNALASSYVHIDEHANSGRYHQHDNPELISEVVHYIEVNYVRPLTINDILTFCPLSRSHFHAIFRQEYGMTFIAALHAVRIRRACELLRTESERLLVDVSHSCGFKSQGHFCHTFKKVMGQSPRQYRRMQMSGDL